MFCPRRYVDEIIMNVKRAIAATINVLSIAAFVGILNNAHWAAIGVALLLVLPVFAISALVGFILSIRSLRRLKVLRNRAWLDAILLVAYSIELLLVVAAVGLIIYIKVVSEVNAM